MRPRGAGILPQSQIFFYDASEAARRMYLYALWLWHYLCGTDYVVKRPSYDSFLLLFVREGTAWYARDGQRVVLPRDSFALIDCYQPHEYGAVTPCELYWVHFDGPTARALCETVWARKRPVPRSFERCRRSLTELCERTAQSGCLEEPEVNRMLVNALTEFLVLGDPADAPGDSRIEAVRAYILENPDKDLTLETLARRASLSPYHFARTFKRQVGLSPHDYLILARLNLAKFYLMSSNSPIKEIAYSCGFSSEASFCATFKSRLGMTATDYRQRQSN